MSNAHAFRFLKPHLGVTRLPKKGSKIVPDLEKYLIRDSGHWTQQEQPGEVSAKIIEWRKRRFG